VGGRGVVDKGDFSFLKKSLVTYQAFLAFLQNHINYFRNNTTFSVSNQGDVAACLSAANFR
jgi:hypothetical protein